MYDLIIVGAGPAGITAGVYAARKQMRTLIISIDVGGQAAWSGDVENYTGYQFITGPELATKFEEHVRRYGIELREGEQVTGLRKENAAVLVESERDTYSAKAVIVASGKRSRELGVPGEKEFKNRGLTYCATCDGPLFKGKNVAVIGGGNSALDAALQLMNIADHVSLVNINSELNGDVVMGEKVKHSGKVTVLNNTRITRVLGKSMVEAIDVVRNGREEKIPVEGVFVEIGLIPNSEFAGILEKNEKGEIRVDGYNRTNIPGIFAAGDVTDVPEKQIIIAAGEGSKAMLGAFRYISQKRWKD